MTAVVIMITITKIETQPMFTIIRKHYLHAADGAAGTSNDDDMVMVVMVCGI